MRARDETEGNNSNTMASYSRDEVSGPLKGVGKEDANFEQDTVSLDTEETNRVIKKEIKVTRGAKVSVVNSSLPPRMRLIVRPCMN